jgi:hypothetical protein
VYECARKMRGTVVVCTIRDETLLVKMSYQLLICNNRRCVRHRFGTMSWPTLAIKV